MPPARSAAPGPTPDGSPNPRSRDLRIDALRGFFIVSMTAGHLAGGTIVDQVTHPLRWVDGASGFVLFSGLVLGMMLSRRPLTGERSALRWLWRRAAVLWVAHVALVAFAMTMRVTTDRLGFVPTPAELGGAVATVFGVGALQVQPYYLTVLPLYVVLLGLAGPAVVWALRGGHWQAVVAASAAVYLVAQVDPHFVRITDAAETQRMWSLGAWQALFVGGLVVGWHWRERVHPWLRRRREAVVGVAVVFTLTIAVLANAYDMFGGAGSALQPVVDTLFGKGQMRPGRVALLLAAVVTGHALLGAMSGARVPAVAARFLAAIGSKSLDCYLLLSVVQLAVFAAFPDRGVLLATVLVVATLLGMRALAERGAAAKVDPGRAVDPKVRGSRPLSLRR
jgi:hypothetical protein